MCVTKSSLLIDLQTGGKNEAWQEFVNTYRPLIEQTVRKAGIAPCDVDDTIQEVLLHLFKSFPRFQYRRDRGQFRHWLRRVTTNKIYDRFRRQEQSIMPLEQPELIPEPQPSQLNVIEESRRQLFKEAMEKVRLASKPKTWQCFELHVLKSCTGVDAAKRLGVKENAIYVNSFRILRRIRAVCEAKGEEFPDAEFTLPRR